MNWFLYDNGLHHERVKIHSLSKSHKKKKQGMYHHNNLEMFTRLHVTQNPVYLSCLFCLQVIMLTFIGFMEH